MAFVDLAVEGFEGVGGESAAFAIPWGVVGRFLKPIGAAFAGMFGFGWAVSESSEGAGLLVLLGLLALLVTVIVVAWALGRIR